ncbi:MAG TPA: hypothetical protein VF406_03800 [Thermodesulfobacteriota bacterium]
MQEGARELERVSQNRRARLEWALDFAQRRLDQLPEPAWLATQAEVAAFSRPSGGWFDQPVERSVAAEDEIRQTQQAFRKIFLALIGTRRATLGPYRFEEVITTRPSVGAEVAPVSESGTTVEYRGLKHDKLMTFLLARSLEEYAHLIRVCPAPAPRREPGEVCGRWFLAERSNQAYCSPQCQSRTATRRSRAQAARTRSGRARAAAKGKNDGK